MRGNLKVRDPFMQISGGLALQTQSRRWSFIREEAAEGMKSGKWAGPGHDRGLMDCT